MVDSAIVPRVIAVAQHDDDAPSGLLEPWAAQRGLDLRVVRPNRGEPLPEDADALVVLGSEADAVPGERDWVDAELGALAERARVMPVFGICFGAQALAVALGGGRRRAPAPEIGWVRIAGDDPAVAPGPWFEWHHDVIEPPPGAEVLARNAAGVQAYAVGRHLAVQFHPEVTPAIVSSWADSGTASLARAGLDPEALVRETEERAAAVSAAAQRLFDTFARRAGLLPDTARVAL